MKQQVSFFDVNNTNLYRTTCDFSTYQCPYLKHLKEHTVFTYKHSHDRNTTMIHIEYAWFTKVKGSEAQKIVNLEAAHLSEKTPAPKKFCARCAHKCGR